MVQNCNPIEILYRTEVEGQESYFFRVKRRASSSAESVAAPKKIIAAQAQELRQAVKEQDATSEVLRSGQTRSKPTT
jgi:hypothetical protein